MATRPADRQQTPTLESLLSDTQRTTTRRPLRPATLPAPSSLDDGPAPWEALPASPPAQTSQARADARLRKLREQTDMSSDRDKFWAPKPPDGWDYQWKRRTIYGQEDPSYQVELIRQGWEPVPLSRHPAMMPPGWKGETIEVEGQVLMERPYELTREARISEINAARENVAQKERQLGLAGRDELSRDGKREVSLKKSFEPIPVPKDSD